ncbi:amidohydrolase family protein [Pelagibacteraceae bacterium]|nr:amidohydrolase family protein [Pelagibacteraceae bacterium]
MNIIDAHHHLWDLSVFPYPWMNNPHPTGDISHLKKNYLVNDLLEDAKNLELIKSVHIQCGGGINSPVEESKWVQSISDKHGFPHGMVVFSDLLSDNAEKEIEEQCDLKNTRGVRYLLNYIENDPINSFASKEALLDSTFKKNYSLLEKYNLSFDLHLWWTQYDYALELIKSHPNILNIINHAGTPRKRDKEYLDKWRDGLKKLAQVSNTVLKISGLGMFDQQWTTESIKPLVNDCIEIFGVDRCFFSTNFPVDKKYSTYEKVWNAYFEITKDFSLNEKEMLFSKNAEKYYRI